MYGIYLQINKGKTGKIPTCNQLPVKPVFKIEVFNALQTQFGPSKRNPKLKMKTSLEVLNIICPPQEPTRVGHCHYKKWS
jgi:hypothetical protein